MEALLGKTSYSEAKALLESAGLHPDAVPEKLYGVRDWEGRLTACAGANRNVIQYVAALKEARGEGAVSSLISFLVTQLREEGWNNVFLFTKPENERLFASLGFSLCAGTEEALLMELRRGGAGALYAPLRLQAAQNPAVVVMNADPFTNGHLHLATRAAEGRDGVYVLVVESDRSHIPFSHRLELVRRGTAGIAGVKVLPGGPYVISQATFPTYFLKEPSHGAAVHARLDATVFALQVAPALGAAIRFVGTEPLDPMTRDYNLALSQLLPRYGIELTTVPRLELRGRPVSASTVRGLWAQGELAAITELVPPATLSYLKEHPC